MSEAGAIWTNTMPKNLAKFIPFVSADERAALFGSITDVTQYPRGDPIREGVIEGMLWSFPDDSYQLISWS